MSSLQSIIGILLLYLALYWLIQGYRNGNIKPEERKTYWVVGLIWAVSVFVGNYLLFKIGAMSFTPWINNVHHTFIWIGLVLTYLYMSTRYNTPMWRQIVYFVVFSFIVKYAERYIFGIWEHEHFLWIFKGNFAYILGWSILDGLYPLITNFGLKIMGKFVPGLIYNG